MAIPGRLATLDGKLVGRGRYLPEHTPMDIEKGCLYGITAMCDQSASFDEFNAAIDAPYGSWAYADSAIAPV